MSTLQSMPFIDENRAISNLYAIASLNAGEKITCDQMTGEIKKDDRVFLVSLRRGYYGAYDHSIVNITFEKSMELLTKEGMDYSLEGHRVSTGLNIQRLDVLVEMALNGLAVLATTYQSEVKDRGVKDLEMRFREELQKLKQPIMDLSVQEKASANVEVEEEVCDGGLFASSDEFKAPKPEVLEQASAAPKEDPHEEKSTAAVDESMVLAVGEVQEQFEARENDDESDHSDPGEERGDIPLTRPSLAQMMIDDLQELADETSQAYHSAVDGAVGAVKSLFDWIVEPFEEGSESSDHD